MGQQRSVNQKHSLPNPPRKGEGVHLHELPADAATNPIGTLPLAGRVGEGDAPVSVANG